MRRHPSPLLFDHRLAPPRPRRRLAGWGALMLLAIALLVGWHSARAQLPEISAGQLLFTDTGGTYQPALLLDSSVHFRVSGLINRVELRQAFHNSGDDWREAIYAFPLPEQAAVRALRIWIGDRLIEGEIHERQQASAIYQRARDEGRKAGLLEQQRPNLFTTAVANIGPGERVVVELEYIDTVAYDNGRFSFRFPMTLTPRYIPGLPLPDSAEQSLSVASGSGWARPTDQVPDADRITPPQRPDLPGEGTLINPIRISADIDAGLPLADIDSRYHPITLHQQGERYRLELAAGSVSMERDFELQWRARAGDEPQAALFTEAVAGDQFALLMLVPPQLTGNSPPPPREVIYVIDTSGSMAGVSIAQAQASLQLALERLRPEDRFNVIEFNSHSNALFPAPVPATGEHIARARHWVAGLQATGGTEMRSALELALAAGETGQHLRQLIFITDGAVGNEAELFALIHQRLGSARLFTVGIGSAPNSHFMRRAAHFGRGSFTHISSQQEVHERMSALFAKLDAPLVTDLALRWPAGTTVDQLPAALPDLYRGEPLQVSARLSQLQGELVISGRSGGQPWERRLTLVEGAPDRNGVAARWARMKIEQLLDTRLDGRSEEAIRADVLGVALPHRLLSPYTSFVAVEQAVSRPEQAPLARSAVANARPLGQAAQPFAWPATATDGTESLILGLALLAIVWAMRRACRQESEHDLDRKRS